MDYLETSSNSHDFDLSYEEGKIRFHVLKFDQSCFVWIGRETILKNLCLAMPAGVVANAENKETVSTKLLGDKADTFDQYLAEKLSKKTKTQIYVSCNIPANSDDFLLRLIEKRIFDEVKQFPEKFY